MTEAPLGPIVRGSHLLGAKVAAGRWRHHDAPITMLVAEYRHIPFTTGVYLIVTRAWQLVRLGQACRDDDVQGRIADHLRWPERAALAAMVHIVGLDDYTPAAALSCIEGAVADLVGCRGRMGRQRWPSSAGWLELCA